MTAVVNHSYCNGHRDLHGRPEPRWTLECTKSEKTSEIPYFKATRLLTEQLDPGRSGSSVVAIKEAI